MGNNCEYINFRIGGNTGKLLMEIAQEKLTYDLNYRKAIDTFTNSLEGFPEEQAYRLLTGEAVLVVNEEEQTVEIVERDEQVHADYPKLDIEEWCERKRKWILKEYKEYNTILDAVESALKRGKKDFIDLVTFEDILEYVKSDGDIEPIRSKIEELAEDCDMLKDIDSITNEVKKYLRKCDLLYKLFDWFYKTYPEKNLVYYTERMEGAVQLWDRLLKLKNGNYEPSPLDEYFESSISNDKILSEPIKPVNILNNYSAGWLAPNGDFYGLNGTVANMLHIAIANALEEAGILPEGDEMDSFDSRLEKAGWVKIHGNWILYGGYDINRYTNKEKIPITDVQLEKIISYGKVCHEGILKIGYNQQVMPAIRLSIVDKFMLEKYFSIDCN